MAQTFNAPYFLDVIGTSYCRSRAIACTKDEYEQFETWRIAKGNLVVNHQKWIDTIMKQCDQLKIGLKAYRYLSCLLYTSPSPRDGLLSRMPSSA